MGRWRCDILGRNYAAQVANACVGVVSDGKDPGPRMMCGLNMRLMMMCMFDGVSGNTK
jgi:hypothetical protein